MKFFLPDRFIQDSQYSALFEIVEIETCFVLFFYSGGLTRKKDLRETNILVLRKDEVELFSTHLYLVDFSFLFVYRNSVGYL